MGYPVYLPTILFGDNQGANALTRNPEHHQQTKHIDVRDRFVSTLVEDGIVSVLYIPTDLMLADIFTKGLLRTRHLAHCQLIGLAMNQPTSDPSMDIERQEVHSKRYKNIEDEDRKEVHYKRYKAFEVKSNDEVY